MANRRHGMLEQRRKRACEEQIQPHLGKFHHVLRPMKPKAREDIRILLNITGYCCPAHLDDSRPNRLSPGYRLRGLTETAAWARPNRSPEHCHPREVRESSGKRAP